MIHIDFETPLLITAGILSVEFLDGLAGLLVKAAIVIYTIVKTVDVIRNWRKK